MMDQAHVLARVEQLEQDLQTQVTRRLQLEQALAQTTAVIERLQGAIGLAREILNGTGDAT